jgi:ADP-heptose:LPS heptosyltransferase
VQVGEGNQRLLENTEDATGKHGIRGVASVVKASSLFVGPEGGLMHLANSVGTRAAIVYGGYVHPELTGYRENINMFSDIACAPCGLRRKCLHKVRKCMERISPEAVYENVLSAMKQAGASPVD